MEIIENKPLTPYTYYKIGGLARYYAKPESIDDLNTISDFLNEKQVPFFIMGAGSNILVNDKGFDGLIIHTTGLNRTLKNEFHDDKVTVTAGASVMVIQVLRLCMSDGIAGLEYLAGIPGSMGGVFYMNAGTNLGEIKDSVVEIDTYNLHTKEIRTLTRKDFKFSYRKNHSISNDEIILSGVIEGEKGFASEVQDTITKLLEKRKASQPIDKPSCGSVFKNPEGHNAWKLIADAGLRGKRIGNAQISEMHTNFIVNLGGAKAADVRALIDLAKAEVLKKSGVTLHEEVQFIGF